MDIVLAKFGKKDSTFRLADILLQKCSTIFFFGWSYFAFVSSLYRGEEFVHGFFAFSSFFLIFNFILNFLNSYFSVVIFFYIFRKPLRLPPLPLQVQTCLYFVLIQSYVPLFIVMGYLPFSVLFFLWIVFVISIFQSSCSHLMPQLNGRLANAPDCDRSCSAYFSASSFFILISYFASPLSSSTWQLQDSRLKVINIYSNTVYLCISNTHRCDYRLWQYKQQQCQQQQQQQEENFTFNRNFQGYTDTCIYINTDSRCFLYFSFQFIRPHSTNYVYRGLHCKVYIFFYHQHGSN